MSYQNNKKPFGSGNNNGKQYSGGGKPFTQPLERITAPYNFVPLSKKVFFPDWADQVSHDIPFKDGISGELTCELVTDTPVYVRNGGKWKHEDIINEIKDNPSQSFFRVGDDFIIPGTTIKGMLRNVIEIASFGKMNKIDDHRYSVRDLKNKEFYLNKMKNVQSAWLKQAADGNGWILVPCDYALISHDLLGNESIKAAQNSLNKYEKWGWDKLDVKFRFKKGTVANRVTALSGDESGKLVFTGQPTANRGGKFDKKNEFVFFARQDKQAIEVPSKIQADINFIYTNPNTGKPYKEWEHWAKELEAGREVPVFYQMNGSELGSFGFTRMYRLPYDKTIKQMVENRNKEHFHVTPDLAETIFGYINESKDALKGRISISPAIADISTVKQYAQPLTAVLGAPKPTFYPNYVSQPLAGTDGKLSTTSGYSSYLGPKSTINGWKRYPTRKLENVERKPDLGNDNDNTKTKFIPIDSGARFTFKIKVHNVTLQEIGAVLWSLTWGNNTKLRHSLGMGKSLGFGVAGITIQKSLIVNTSGQNVECSHAMKSYTDMMDRVVGGDWLKTAQLEQLLAMADPAVVPQCLKLKHMSLANKDFSNVKGGTKPPLPSLALLPHVKPTAISDDVRFKNLQPHTTGKSPENNKQNSNTSIKAETANFAQVPAGPVDLSGLASKFTKKR